VADQHGAPTSAAWLADTTAAVIGQVLQQGGSPAAVYHATCSGKTSWYGFARAIFERLQLDRPPELEPLPSEAYPTPARRPAFSVLSNERLLTDFSVVRQNWEAALDGVIRVMRSERTGIDSA
jgi:dTDP-4-dehydrorhamnose reductase